MKDLPPRLRVLACPRYGEGIDRLLQIFFARRRGQIFILRILEVGRRGQIFTLRILGVSKKRPVSHPRLSALVTDTKDAAGIARAYLEHHYTGLPVPAEGSYAGPRTANSPASAG